MRQIKGYVFDVDGTLLDTYEHIVTAFEKVLSKNGIPSRRDTIRSVIGMTLHECYEVLAPEHTDRSLLAETHHELQQSSEMYELIKVYEGLFSVLDIIQQRGFKAFVVTNRSRVSLELIFKHVGLAEKFDLVITKDEVSSPKPNPEGLLAIAKASGLKPSELAMIGDTGIDIQAGMNAGVGLTIAMTHGFGTLDELTAAKPDYIFASFAELEGVISES
jgi:HAD superfamily hydrolase (TIGR01549 family)